MGAAMNGSAKSSSKANGYIKTEPGTSPVTTKSGTVQKRGFLAALFALVVRVLVWYSIGTIILRCPKDAAQLTTESPGLCKPYLQFRDFTQPYTKPYYDSIVGPQIEKVQPYLDYANERYVTPASTFAQQNYIKYGAPQVEWAQKCGQEQWESILSPQVASAREAAYKQYSATLGPHVQKVDEAIRPYYTGLTASANDFWELELRPAYHFVTPYAQKGYSSAAKFTNNVVLPYSQWANGILWVAIDRHVLPTVRVVYGENVEPQIMRIKQRLGRYRDEKKVESVFSASTTPASETSSAAQSVSASVASAYSSVTAKISSATASPSVATAPAEESKSAAEQFSGDLRLWEQQVTRAASEGADHLKDRIKDICTEQQDGQIKKVGQSLVVQLEELESSGVKDVQNAILKAVSNLPEDTTEDNVSVAQKDIETHIRTTGRNIRQKAQHIREWRKKLELETSGLVEAAANSTLETIENIRDLRLHEIGRRWSSHDGITHRDWAAYNKLKKSPGEWQTSISNVVQSHSSLKDVHDAAVQIEEQAMAVAEDAAKELGRLKSVSLWKLRAQDDSDNFESKIVPPIVAKVSEQISEQVMEAAEQASEAVAGTTQGAVESVTSRAAEAIVESASIASSGASSLSSSASEKILGPSDPVSSISSKVAPTSVGSSITSAASAASVMAESVESSLSSQASDAASAVSDYVKPASDTNSASAIKSTASSLSSIVSESASKATEGAADAASDVSSSAPSVISAATEAAVNVGDGFSIKPQLSSVSDSFEDAASSASSVASSVSSAVSSAVPDADGISQTAKKATSRVFAGAMAQAVPAQQPIMDAEPFPGDANDDVVQSVLDAVSREVETLSSAVNQAITGKPTATGIVPSASSIASELYQSAMDAAASVLKAPEPTGTEKAAKFASDKYDEAVQAASRVIYGTPKPLYEQGAEALQSRLDQYTSSASSRWSEAIEFAKSQSEVASKRVSEQISGTPKPIHEQMFQSVNDAYWQALKGARSKYDNAIAQTTVIEQQAVPPYQSISSVASSQLAAALTAVSEQYAKATSAAGLAPTPAHQSVYDEARRQYYEGLGIAHDRYSSYVSSATRALKHAGLPVMPTSTPVYQSFLYKAQSQYAAASSAAQSVLDEALASGSSIVGATSTGPVESVASAASEQYSSALSAASSLLYQSQTPAYAGMMSAAESRYSDLAADAYNAYGALTSAALSAAGATTTENAVYDSAIAAASSQYSVAMQAVNSGLGRASSQARAAVYGTQTGAQASASSAFSSLVYGKEESWTDQVAGQARENWEAIVSKASEQVYGQPTPVYASITSQFTSVASQASSAADAQYSAIASLFSSVVSGREADFSDRVFAQLSAAYYTGAPAAVSSVSSVAADAYSSASSAVSSMFTPPATIDDILTGFTAQLDSAVSAASAGVYGTEKGTVEKATSAAAASASDVTATLSEAAERANKAISEALFGPPTPTSVVDQVSDGASRAYEAANSKVAEVFGAEKTGAWEGYQKQIAQAIEDARKRLEVAASGAGESAAEATESVKEAVQSVVERVKDEL